MRRGLFVGRLLGIEFYLDYSWFLIAALLTYTLTVDVFPGWVPGLRGSAYVLMGFAGALLFFLSILLHELGHSVVSQRCGIPVPRITLLFIGGLAEIAREPDDAKSELKIALGGPVVSVVLVVIFGVAAWAFGLASLTAPWAVCTFLSVTNGSLVIFNMIPGYPLDGGRILRALLWAYTGRLRRSTFITSRIGVAFSWVLVIWGLYLVAVKHQWNGFVFFLIALFLKSAAESGYSNAVQREVLGGVKVRDIMTPNPIAIPATLPLNLAVDEYFLANHHVAFPVAGAEGEFRGLLRLEYLKSVPREKWPYTAAVDVVAEQEAGAFGMDAEMSAARAMRRLLAPGFGRQAVVENGRIVGVITRHDVLHFIRIHTELEE
jgi:Zn-dependent protease